MTKASLRYICNSCGHSSPKWLGKCPACEEWNTFTEEVVVKKKPDPVSRHQSTRKSEVQNIMEISVNQENRIHVPDSELNRVLGNGLTPGSVTLIGGEPGIGKSTLLLQLALRIPAKVLYISGEESESQIKMRAERIGIQHPNCHIFCETDTESIIKMAGIEKPVMLIVDSIQTLSHPLIESAPGTVSQIRESAAALIKFAKSNDIPVFLIGHINKDGQIAGPKILEHMVDTVLQFEGDRHYNYRILRTHKNRFGSANEIGIYEMKGSGLREIENPSEILINERDEHLSGISISCAVEGIRPLLIETQALVSSAVYGTPQRSSNGFDLRRLNMLLAVLEKRCGFQLGMKDVFINIAGGMKIEDPGIDLGLIAAILSSYQNLSIDRSVAFAGEIGLSGEVRPVSRIEQRILEAEKLGFKSMMISTYNKGIPEQQLKIKLIKIAKVEDAFEWLFG